MSKWWLAVLAVSLFVGWWSTAVSEKQSWAHHGDSFPYWSFRIIGSIALGYASMIAIDYIRSML